MELYYIQLPIHLLWLYTRRWFVARNCLLLLFHFAVCILIPLVLMFWFSCGEWWVQSNSYSIWAGFPNPTWNEKTQITDLFSVLRSDWFYLILSTRIKTGPTPTGYRLRSYSLNIVTCAVPPCIANSPSATYTLTENTEEFEKEKENHNFKSSRANARGKPRGSELEGCKYQRTVRSNHENNESYLRKMI